MKPELKNAWTTALRLGGFEQTCAGWMRYGNPIDGECEHCCIGVLYEVAHKLDVLDETLTERLKVHKDERMTPYELMHVGLESSEQEQLILMNDRGVPFEDIADWIDENIPAEVTVEA